MSVTELRALFEFKDEGVIHTVSPPEVDISSVHNHMQYHKPKKPAYEMYLIRMLHREIFCLYFVGLGTCKEETLFPCKFFVPVCLRYYEHG